jgi:phytoene synthase
MKAPELPPTKGLASSHLAFALFWLPSERRRDALLFYRFCRAIDDIADDPNRTANEKRRLLDAWLEADEWPSELELLLQRHQIDRSLLQAVVRGCSMDIEPRHYATFAELEEYCWCVACAVGLVSIRIFGCTDPASEIYAVHLGHALQWTNILRDVGEDARQERIYLPLEALDQHGVTINEILGQRPGKGFLSLMRNGAARARSRFAAAEAPKSDFSALLPARIMRAVYEKMLHRLERDRFPVFQFRCRLNTLEKLTLAARTSLERSP